MPRRKSGKESKTPRAVHEPTLGPPLPIPDRILDEAHQATGPLELPDKLIGKKLSARYKVLEKIGEGGMGTIYLAEDERLGKRVVVKMLPQAFSGRVELAERFIQEAKLTSQIEQENIVSITDLVVTSPPFYVMEHLRGIGLGDFARGEGRLAWDERTQDILAQLCRALGAAHKLGIVHRDMKPDNIFLVEHSDGRLFVKILDFGIAKILSESGIEPKDGGPPAEEFASARTGRRHITNVGTVLGTPHYMAPEQGRGGEVDHRSDIYSVGVIMYELLTGSLPFDIPGRESMDIHSAGRILEMHAKDPAVPPRARAPEAGIPEEVEAIILKAMAKSPDERQQSIADMESAIRRVAAPKHRVKAKFSPAPGDGGVLGLPMQGLMRIRQEDESRASFSRKIRAGIAIAALAAAAAGGAIGLSHAFRSVPPAIETHAGHDEEADGGAEGGVKRPEDGRPRSFDE